MDKLLSTASAMPLACRIANALDTVAIPISVAAFQNGQLGVKPICNPVSIFKSDLILIHCFGGNIHEDLFELALVTRMLSAFRPSRITAVLPYLPYSRSDRPEYSGAPVFGRFISEFIELSGVNRLISVDLHHPQIAGFFSCPVMEADPTNPLGKCILELKLPAPIVIAADFGATRRAERMAKLLGAPMAIIQKQRVGSEKESIALYGDATDRNAIVVDDEINSGQTIIAAADLLTSLGARSVHVAAAHALFTSRGLSLLSQAHISQIFVTDSVPADLGLQRKICVTSMATELAALIA